MKFLMVISMAIFMVGCAKETTEVSYKYELPEGLKDCKVYYLQGEGVLASYMRVVRCPNSQTSSSYTSGKTTQSVTTIDGLAAEVKDKTLKLEALKKLTPEERKALGLE